MTELNLLIPIMLLVTTENVLFLIFVHFVYLIFVVEIWRIRMKYRIMNMIFIILYN